MTELRVESTAIEEVGWFLASLVPEFESGGRGVAGSAIELTSDQCGSLPLAEAISATAIAIAGNYRATAETLAMISNLLSVAGATFGLSEAAVAAAF